MAVKNEIRIKEVPRSRRVAFTGYRPQKMPFGFDEEDERCIDFKKRLRDTMSYQIISQNAQQAETEYTYFCPYCMRKSTVRSIVHSPDYERLESGGFYDSLTCSECGQTADVRFWKTMKIE